MAAPSQKRNMQRCSRGAAVVLAASACALGTGCHRPPPVSQADEIRDALNRFYATEPACLWPRAVTLERTKTRPDPIPHSEGRALVHAGLLSTLHHGYTLTNAGRPFWREDPREAGAGNLCFGTWNVSRVVRMTSQPDPLIGTVTATEFEAKITAPALWTRLPAIQQAFPLMAMEVTQTFPHHAIMKHTDKGWQVSIVAVPSLP